VVRFELEYMRQPISSGLLGVECRLGRSARELQERWKMLSGADATEAFQGLHSSGKTYPRRNPGSLLP
jgi:hypothetical protein